MTATLSGFPYTPLRFDAAGALGPGGTGLNADGLAAWLAAGQATDAVLLSHGWRNDAPTAHRLYDTLAASARAVLPRVPGAGGRRIHLVGVHWPSQHFAPVTDPLTEPSSDASAGWVPRTRGARPAEVRDGYERFIGALDPKARADAPDGTTLAFEIERSPSARVRLVRWVQTVLPGRQAPAGALDGASEPDDENGLLAADPEDVVRRLSSDVVAPADQEGDGTVGAGGGVTGRHSRAAVRLLDFGTYAVMRDRAGRIGARGLAPVLDRLHDLVPHCAVHLVGHSFGARLAATAALATARPGQVRSLCLLQAAFSHYGLAHRWDGTADGEFRGLIGQQLVSGPLLVTHTVNDRAVGYPYAVASLLLGHVGVGLGGPDSAYGALGRNGARRTPEADGLTLLGVGEPYTWRSGRVHNLRADAFVSGHHDVAGHEVAHAVLSAVTA
ncbi:hypothetical protein SAMN04487981_14045 [Streptomyces sp. cf386]|uniref:hypothetical protein n=1 Tax=Streptomyces sp. cf386 TaxID=1761904 RepID=UPI0008881649|nr:hypothetical protein [Streptomyces sp. cf386]SDP78600.1 hypothetical protein SAMN04487981_14045 [Streptomyces sp. cf386]